MTNSNGNAHYYLPRTFDFFFFIYDKKHSFELSKQKTLWFQHVSQSCMFYGFFSFFVIVIFFKFINQIKKIN